MGWGGGSGKVDKVFGIEMYFLKAFLAFSDTYMVVFLSIYSHNKDFFNKYIVYLSLLTPTCQHNILPSADYRMNKKTIYTIVVCLSNILIICFFIFINIMS